MGSLGSLGQWPNAPLALVLAQVRFEQIIDMDKQIAAFQKAIATDYPRTTQGNAMTLQLPQGMAPVQPAMSFYVFSNAQRTKSVRIESGALTYTVGEYIDYDHFAAEMQSIVQAFEAALQTPVFVTQLGMRYVDFIVPKQGRGIEDYIEAPLCRMPALGSGSPKGVLNAAEIPYDEGTMRLQCSAGYGPPGLPDELMPNPVELLNNKTPAGYVGPGSVLDFDRIVKPDSPMSGADVLHRLAGMHADLSAAFKKVTTPLAQEEWQTKK